MMDVQSNDIEVEDGELSGSTNDDVEEIYKPLQRPANIEMVPSPLTTCHHLQKALDDDVDDESQDSSSSGESTEDCIKKLRSDEPKSLGKRKRKKRTNHRTVMVRVGSNSTTSNDADMQIQRARFKKYNVWTAALQEDALTENMRDCEVTRDTARDRNVENYDYALKYRLNGDNSLKRRLSNSSEDELHPAHKRGRPSSRQTEVYTHRRHSVKTRREHRSRSRQSRHGTSSTSSSDNSCEARHIKDLDDITGRDNVDIAREIANKLHEEKDELMVRVVEVLGIELPIELYKETQRIEADGGMMIKNGRRRRTPGGVFLFLLKHNNSLTPEQQISIFKQDRQIVVKSRKQIESIMRDRKVEELKKRLSQQQANEQLLALHTRKEQFLLGNELNVDHQTTNLSNPPPSPVGLEQSSPEYKTHAINHVGIDNNDVPTTSAAAGFNATQKREMILVSYDDDILDSTCAEMDFF